MIVFPNCKINLGLHIIQKRTDGFHDLETVFYPLPFRDALEMIQQPSGSQQVEFSASGLSLDIDADSNICLKAYRLLKEQFPDLPPIKMHLHKVIPSGAGLGGGSADGAFSLLLLNKKFNLGLRSSVSSVILSASIRFIRDTYPRPSVFIRFTRDTIRVHP